MISQTALSAADSMLGPPDAKSDSLFAADQILGPETHGNLAGEAWNTFFRDPRKGLVNKAFNDAYDEAYGKQPLGIGPEAEKVLRDYGVWNDYNSNNYSLLKAMNEGVMRPAAAGMDAFMRTMYATARGAEATPWWSPAHPIGAVASAALEGAFPELMPHLRPVGAAKDAGVLDRRLPSPETIARERMAPGGGASEIVMPGLETREATPSPSNIHEAARQIEPDLFSQYDSLMDTKNSYLGMITELDEARANATGMSTEAARIQATLETETSARRRERLQQQLDAQIAHDDALAKERIDSLRGEMLTVDEQMRDIAPDVSDAYRRARDMVPDPPPIEPTPVPEPLTVEPEGADPTILSLAQRRPTIAADVARQLIAAGRPEDEARAGAALVQAHYEARANRFGGALGSARDLYERDDPIIQAGEGRARGRLDLVRNQVTLMKDADASTFVHETAHNWLEELQRDAQNEKAPPDLIADMDAVRSWLGAEDGAITRAQHEKFARGFERYLMEGVAPSNRLATVFNKFKDWLTKIYQTVARLKAPINDQIRGVYDRLLSSPRGETIITPEREVTLDVAGQHERDLATTIPTRDLVVAARDQQGNVYLGKKGQTHADLLDQIPESFHDFINGERGQMGFAGPDGEFLTREEAAKGREAIAEKGLGGGEPFLEGVALKKAQMAVTPEAALEVADRMRAERDLAASTLKTEIESARRRYRSAARATLERGRERVGVSEPGAEPTGVESERAEPPPTTTEVSPSGAKFKAESTVGDDGQFAGQGDRFIDKAGNIRLDNLEAPGDVDAIIRASARYNNDYLLERRGNVSPGQLLGLAEDLGQDPRWLENKQIGQAFNFEEVVAARRLLKDSANAVRERMIETAEGGDPLEFAKAIARHEMIMGKVSQATAEWGRAGHAFRALSEITSTSDFMALDQALRNTGRSYDELLQLARMGKDLPSAGAIANVIRQSTADKIKKGIVYTVTNGYLSGMFTHAGYAAGNLLRNILHIPGTAFEAAVGTLRGAEADRVYWKEIPASFYGFLHGTVAAWEPAYEAWKTGVQPPLPGQKRHGVALWSYDSPFPESVNKVIGAPGRLVSAIHQFARVQFYTQELYRNAVRDSIDRGLGISAREATQQARGYETSYEAQMKGLMDGDLQGRALEREIERVSNYPTNDLINRAADEADKFVFQQRMPYQSWFAGLQRFTQDHPVAKIVFPFITVGYNIAKQTERYSPLAPAVGEYRTALMGRSGGAGFDAAMGKVLFGTSLLGTGIGLGLAGLVTGPGPSEPKARAEWLLTHQPFSAQIGNVWVPIEGLGPHFNLLLFTAGMAQAGQYATKDEINDIAKNYWHVIMHTALNESVFHDFANLGKAIADPEREGPRWLAGVVGGVVPFSAGLSQLNRHILDPHLKEVRPGLEGITDNITARIPFVSDKLYDRRDMFGEQISTRGFQDVTQYANDPTVQWLNRIQTGAAKMPRTLDGVKLSPMQYDDLSRVAGRMSKNFLDQVRPQLEGLPRGMQVMEVNRLIGQARHMARQMLFMNYPQLMIDVTNEKYKKLE